MSAGSDAHVEKVLRELRTANTRLQRILRSASTDSILQYASTSLLSLQFKAKHERLSAPVKQIFHVLGLMLVTAPERAKHISEQEWTAIENLVERVFFLYAHLFFSFTPNDPAQEKLIEATGPAFLQYFQTFALYYEEQLRSRVRSWFRPFDHVVKDSLGLTVEDLLEIAVGFKDQLQEHFDFLLSLHSRFERSRDELMSDAKENDWSIPEIRRIGNERGVTALAKSYFAAMDNLCVVNQTALAERWGDKRTARFLSLFCARRGGVSGYFFPTEKNPAEWQPIFQLDGSNKLFCPLPWTVQSAVMRRLDQTVRTSSERDRFLKHRDLALEGQVYECLRDFLPTNWECYRNFYEGPNQEREHDILFCSDNTFFVVEAKASPPPEPFRDPEKSYIRIRNHFRSDRGIQGGYDQASRLRTLLQSDQDIHLYDSRANEIAFIPTGAKRIFCIVVTADNFGPISTDLKTFLDKKPEEPYPWVVDVFSLETFLAGLKKKGRTIADLLLFLEERSLLHGKVFGTDELEYCGPFLREGNFERLLSLQVAKIFLETDTSRIFDEIYYEEHGQVLPGSSDKRLHLFDARQLLSREVNEDLVSEDQPPVGGRNDPCSCGSGKKYKRCHGR
jgi:hypothetical protein